MLSEGGGSYQAKNKCTLAESGLGDAIASNFFVVGVALQLGWLPLSAAAVERALELAGRGLLPLVHVVLREVQRPRKEIADRFLVVRHQEHLRVPGGLRRMCFVADDLVHHVLRLRGALGRQAADQHVGQDVGAAQDHARRKL